MRLFWFFLTITKELHDSTTYPVHNARGPPNCKFTKSLATDNDSGNEPERSVKAVSNSFKFLKESLSTKSGILPPMPVREMTTFSIRDKSGTTYSMSCLEAETRSGHWLDKHHKMARASNCGCIWYVPVPSDRCCL